MTHAFTSGFVAFDPAHSADTVATGITVSGAADGSGNNPDASGLTSLTTATVTTKSSTEFKLTKPSGMVLDIKGTGFTYSGSTPTGGTITSVWQQDSGATTHQTWTGVSVSLASFWTAALAGDTKAFMNLFFSGNDTFTGHSAGTSSSNDRFFGWTGDDTFKYAGNFTANDTIDGGAGNDTLILNGDYSAGLTFGASTMTNVERLSLGAGHSYRLTLNNAAIASGSYLIVDASALTTANTLYLDDSAETAGQFTVNMGAGMKASDTLIAGALNGDTLALSGDYSGGLTFGASTLSGFEDISVAAGYNYKLVMNDANVAAGRSFEVYAASLSASDSLNFDGSAETNGVFVVLDGPGNDTIKGGAGADFLEINEGGNDTVSGMAGNDTIYCGAALSAADKLDGGAGTDVAELEGDYSAGLTLGAATIANIEEITCLAGHSYKLTTNDANVASGKTLTIDATALTSSYRLIFSGAAEANGKFAIRGGAGSDTLTGGAGADRITGGGGADKLKGGDGADTYVYKAAKDSTQAKYDVITGFDAAADKIDLWFGISGINTSRTTGALNSGSTFDSDLTAAIGTHLTSHHAILFKPDSGTLSGHQFLLIDVNGTAGYQAGADLVIELASPVHLTSLAVGTFT